MSDTLWNDVSLLLPFDGTDGATSTTDQSDLANAITLHGAIAIDTAESKFGGSSLNGPTETSVGNYLSLPLNSALIDTTGDYSIQFWYKAPADVTTGFDCYLLDTYEAATNTELMIRIRCATISGGVALFVDFDLFGPSGRWLGAGSNRTVNPIVPGQWHYLEFTQVVDDGLYVFVDGQIAEHNNNGASAGPPPALAGSTMYLAGRETWGDLYGWIEDFRITNGTARNTAAYSVPTTAHPIGLAQSVYAEFPSLLSYLGRSEKRLAIELPSLFGALSSITVNDFTSLITDPASRYVLRIEGATTFDVPISSWQATLNIERQSFLQAVVPAYASYAEDIAASQASGEMAIYRQTNIAGSIAEKEMARASIDTIQVNSGPVNNTATLRGYLPQTTDPAPASTIELTGVRQMSQTVGGATRVRCDIDWLLRPGQTVSYGADTFNAEYINYFVPSSGDSYMDVGDRG